MALRHGCVILDSAAAEMATRGWRARVKARRPWFAACKMPMGEDGGRFWAERSGLRRQPKAGSRCRSSEAAGRYEPVDRLVTMCVAEAVEGGGGLLMGAARAVSALFGEEARQRS